MHYRFQNAGDHLRAELFGRQTVEETLQFIAALVAEARQHSARRILIWVRNSRPIFKVEQYKLSEQFKRLAALKDARIALLADADEVRASHQYIEVLATQQGLSVFDTVLMSATIFAGASQMVGIELFGQDIPAWVIVFSIFAVNFRHVLYSASFGRHARHWTSAQRLFGFFFLTDPQYAEAESRHEKGTPVTFAWYMGLATALYVGWVANAAVGGWFGGLIPDTHAFGIDFLLPIYFLALVMGFRKRDRFLPIVAVSALASIAGMHFVGSPWHVSIGALAGIVLPACLPQNERTPAPRAVEKEA